MKLWPFGGRAEKRESGGDFSDAVVRLIESQAAGSAASASSTAAVEAAAGALSRAFAAATVEAEPWAVAAITPGYLAQVGRDLVRQGRQPWHVVQVGMAGVRLIPCSSWHWEGSHDPATWTVRATAYGPSTSTTWNMAAAGVVFVTWGSNPGQPYIGTAPTDWAHTTARLQSEAERSLADESAGPLAQLLAIPQDGGDDGDDDPLKDLKADLRTARGKALLVETSAAGWGEGKASAPQRDWAAARLGPMPPDSMVQVAADAFARVLAACGAPPPLFLDSDGTSQREALRRWHMGTVEPLARILAHELTAKLETPVAFRFDKYPLDLAGRASAFKGMVAGGVDVDRALAITGLLGRCE